MSRQVQHYLDKRYYLKSPNESATLAISSSVGPSIEVLAECEKVYTKYIKLVFKSECLTIVRIKYKSFDLDCDTC